MSTRLEVLIDGEWTPVPAEPVEFTPEPMDEAEVAFDGEQSWTIEGTTAGEPGEFWDAIRQAQREAFARGCARRMWLTYPYRLKGLH